MDMVINNTGDRESGRGKDCHGGFEPERMKRERLALLDMGKLGEETNGRNFRAG